MWTSTFTWTAVMQLVQDGKINLDADVNQYLDFHIDSAGAVAARSAVADVVLRA